MGLELEEGVWMPIERSDFEAYFITLAIDLPGRMQAQLDRLRLIEVPAIVNTELRRHLEAARARWLRESLNESGGSFQDWMVGFMVVGAAIVGALLYAGAHAIMNGG